MFQTLQGQVRVQMFVRASKLSAVRCHQGTARHSMRRHTTLASSYTGITVMSQATPATPMEDEGNSQRAWWCAASREAWTSGRTIDDAVMILLRWAGMMLSCLGHNSTKPPVQHNLGRSHRHTLAGQEQAGWVAGCAPVAQVTPAHWRCCCDSCASPT